MTPQEALARVIEHREIFREEMLPLMRSVMSGEVSPVLIAAIVTGLRVKKETIGEIAAAAEVMREFATKVPVPDQPHLIDTCGTGGDAMHSFNISTAAMFAAAAAGAKVAKHGGRSVSSKSGSADVLEALGADINLKPEQVARSIAEVGVGFMFAPNHHGAMKHAAPVRRELGVKTIFNILGPLTNPAGAQFQLIGANRIENAAKLAGALAQLDPKKALVVCGNNELDEVSLWGETTVFVVQRRQVSQLTWTAASFGLPPCSVDDLRVQSPAESADVIRGVLSGRRGPAREIVLANAAAALVAACQG